MTSVHQNDLKTPKHIHLKCKKNQILAKHRLERNNKRGLSVTGCVNVIILSMYQANIKVKTKTRNFFEIFGNAVCTAFPNRHTVKKLKHEDQFLLKNKF